MTEIALTSSALILFLIIIRRLLRGRIAPLLQYGLWLLVALRLLIPGSLFPSPVSVIGAVEEVRSAIEEEAAPISQDAPVAAAPLPASPDPMAPDRASPVPPAGAGSAAAPSVPAVSPAVSGVKAIRWQTVWLVGAALVSLALLVSNLTFYVDLRQKRRRLELSGTGAGALPVYLVEDLPSPCLFGLLCPAVYINRKALLSPHLDHILVHELTHFRHGDHLWTLLRGLCLAVHWYNPLVWWAAALSRQDCELACDDGVISLLGEEERLDYGATLVSMIVPTSSPMALLRASTTMTDGKRTMKERISLIAKRPRMLKITLAAVVVMMALAVALTFGGVKEAAPPSENDPLLSSPDGLPPLTEEAVLEELYPQAREAWDWFELGTIPTTNDSYTSNQGTVFRVDGFDTLEELRGYLLTRFTPELADHLLTNYQTFLEISGALFVEPAGRGSSIYARQGEVTVFLQDEAGAAQYGYNGLVCAATEVLDEDLTTVLGYKRHEWHLVWNGENYVFSDFGPWDDADPQLFHSFNYTHSSGMFSLALPENWAEDVVIVESEDGVDFYEANTYAQAGYGWLMSVFPQPASWTASNAGEDLFLLDGFDTNGTPHQYILEYRLSLDFPHEPAAEPYANLFQTLLAQRQAVADGFRLLVTPELISQLAHDNCQSDIARTIAYLPYLSWENYRGVYGEAEMEFLLAALWSFSDSGKATWEQTHDILSVPADRAIDGAYATGYQDIFWALYQRDPQQFASVLGSVYISDTERANVLSWLRYPLSEAVGRYDGDLLTDQELYELLQLSTAAPSEMTLHSPGESFRFLPANILGIYAATYSSDDPSVASVDSSTGTVTAVGPGTAAISLHVECSVGQFDFTCAVHCDWEESSADDVLLSTGEQTDGEIINGIVRGWMPTVMDLGSPENLEVELSGEWSIQGIQSALWDALSAHVAGTMLDGSLFRVAISYSFQFPDDLHDGAVLTVPYTASYSGKPYSLPSGSSFTPSATTNELTATVRLVGEGVTAPADEAFQKGQTAYQRLAACVQIPEAEAVSGGEPLDILAYIQESVEANLAAAGLSDLYQVGSTMLGSYTAPHQMEPGESETIDFSLSFTPLTDDGVYGISLSSQLTVRIIES